MPLDSHARFRDIAMPSALVVEDDRKVLRGIAEGLRLAGYDVETAENGEAGIRLASKHPFDCVILDWMLPGRDGIGVLTGASRFGTELSGAIVDGQRRD